MENNKCPICQSDLDEMGVCTECGYVKEAEPVLEYPMNWYKFVVYFQLFANIIANVMTGVSLFNGSIFGTGAYHIYTLFPLMSLFNKFMGACYFGLCIYTVFVWKQLREFRQDAPFYLALARMITLGLGLVSNVGLLLISKLPLSTFFLDLNLMTSMVGVLVMLLLEKKYFKRRKDLFIY